MVKRRNTGEEEEEEEETGNLPLLITSKVVEYLEPVMSEELLCKFPDNSSFGFDYSQSSLWSPLVPRTIGRPTDSATRRDLTRELGELQEEKNSQTKQRKEKKKKKKFLGFDVSATKKKKMKTKMAMRVKMGSGFSSADPLKVGCFGVATKGWNDMLKAASKHFKKTKKRDPIIKLSNYLKFPQI